MISKSIFRSGPDFTLNACVGRNTGSSEDHGYITGFAQAALILVAAAKSQYIIDPKTDEEIVGYQDALIYPICFNARHHIELFLKRQIERVAGLRQTVFEHNVLSEHDLSELLKELGRLCHLVDRRLPAYLEPLKSAITAFAEIDPNGQTFRYRKSLGDKLHLEGLEHINLAVLETALKDLFSGTEEFERQSDALTYEYDQGTMTSELSRYELDQLSRALPPRSEWALSTKFKEVKSDFMGRFNLSGQAFSRAIKLIQNHHEFAGRIGMELPLPHVNHERLHRIIALDADGELLDAFSEEEWAVLDAIFEVGEQFAYSELFAHRLRQLAKGEADVSLTHDIIRGITAKPDRFRRGLVKLGQQTLAQEVDTALAARGKSRGGSEAGAVSEFNRMVRQHFSAKLLSSAKYGAAATVSEADQETS